MSNSNNPSVRINIDNQFFEVPSGLTILQAAEANNVYIPTLCAHKDLTPFGGCRMCVVEVDGIRGFPTSCTTPVGEGMVIRTQTSQLQALRQDVLQLILSEHPTNCLFCEETVECLPYMFTVRKGEMITGCNSCPQNNQCELQDITHKMGLEQLNYPFKYRNFPVEHYDPFYDRDYNLCILCGRCIRECQEVRGANVLSFKQRGPHTIIGPAFERTHLEAGCEFCGACVAVCPTGTLSEKTSKWMGKHDSEVTSTCPLCGIACQINILTKNSEFMSSRPSKTSIVSDQLCVKGRFGIFELVNNDKRLKEPYHVEGKYRTRMSWEEAVHMASEKLAVCPPEEFGMLVSADCSNEDLYIAQKFTRLVMHSNQIDTTSRRIYGDSFNAYTSILKNAAPLSNLSKSDLAFCIGLDPHYGRSVVSVEIRKAIHNGAKVITLHPRPHNLTLVADVWLRPQAGEELQMFNELASLIEGETRANTSPEVVSSAKLLQSALNPFIILGPEFHSYEQRIPILDAVARIVRKTGAQIAPLPAQGNLLGSILMKSYPEMSAVEEQNPDREWNSLKVGIKLQVLYHMGAVPVTETRRAEFEIFQNFALPETSLLADLILPAAAFTETEGTLISADGFIQHLHKAVEPPGKALPNWMILCRIAQKMGFQGFDFKTTEDIDHEIEQQVIGFTGLKDVPRSKIPLQQENHFTQPELSAQKRAKPSKKYPFLLVAEPGEENFMGYTLTNWVKGLKPLLVEETVFINPSDAQSYGISAGDNVTISSSNFEKSLAVKISSDQPQGTLFLRLHQAEVLSLNPTPVALRRKDV